MGHNGRVYSLKIGKGKRPTVKDFLPMYKNFYNKYKDQGDKIVKMIAEKYNWTYTIGGGKK